MTVDDSTRPTHREAYDRDGFVAPVPIVSEAEARRHRVAMETAEATVGPLHYREKIHTILTAPFELATHPTMLDTVEALIGPDILLYNVTFIVKEPRTDDYVAWHQDLAYWGLSSDRQVSAWLALSPATAESGCMQMVPGSHRRGRIEHQTSSDARNLLYNDQQVVDVDDSAARPCPLRPGEASFHHGWTLHASRPNTSDDRRIGLNIQYVAPCVRQTLHDRDTALLVRGTDEYGHFTPDVAATVDLDPVALTEHAALMDMVRQTFAAAAEQDAAGN